MDKSLDQDIFRLTCSVLEQVAHDIDESLGSIPVLQEKTMDDMVKCHQLLRVVEQREVTSDVEKIKYLLVVIKQTLTSIAKDTAVKPEFQHPLQDSTIKIMRECFVLLTQREREIGQGEASMMRPYFIDEPPTSGSVEVPLFRSLKTKKH